MHITDAEYRTLVSKGFLTDHAAKSPIIQVECCPNGTVRLTVPGPPPGKPRMTRQDRWKKRPATDRYWAWANAIKEAVGNSIPEAASVALLNWTAYFEPPTSKSWPKKRRIAAIGTLHRAKPDRDNIDKAVLDCLWPDGDSAIAAGTIRKFWDWTPRIEIEITLEKG